MARARNPHVNHQPRSPHGTFTSDNPMGQPVCVSLPMEIDQAVRALPNRSEWLRKVIVEAAQRELLGKEDVTEG